MGEERYIKQIISDVMEMAAKIKFLEAKVAASESWSAECTDDHKRELAAALRRAKAEVLEAAAKHFRGEIMDPDGKEYLEGYNSALRHVSAWIELDAAARAAQIEEGDK